MAPPADRHTAMELQPSLHPQPQGESRKAGGHTPGSWSQLPTGSPTPLRLTREERDPQHPPHLVGPCRSPSGRPAHRCRRRG